MELTRDQRAELQAVVKSADVPAPVATRARVVLWRAEGRLKKQIAELAGVSRPTVDLWLDRYEAEGLAGLIDRSHAAPREQVPAPVRARILAATRTSHRLVLGCRIGRAGRWRLSSSEPKVCTCRTTSWRSCGARTE
jgi:hypothetical protein